MVLRAAVNAYTLWTILHITEGHGDMTSGVAVNPCILYIILHITAREGKMVWGVVVNPYTL